VRSSARAARSASAQHAVGWLHGEERRIIGSPKRLPPLQSCRTLPWSSCKGCPGVRGPTALRKTPCRQLCYESITQGRRLPYMPVFADCQANGADMYAKLCIRSCLDQVCQNLSLAGTRALGGFVESHMRHVRCCVAPAHLSRAWRCVAAAPPRPGCNPSDGGCVQRPRSPRESPAERTVWGGGEIGAPCARGVWTV
jgi:hypothetical protein